MQFMSSSLEKLVKNLTDDGFKYLTEKFCSKISELLIQKDAYHYKYMDSFKRFGEEKLPDNECFYSSLKMEQLVIMKKIDGHIGNKDYWTYKKNLEWI